MTKTAPKRNRQAEAQIAEWIEEYFGDEELAELAFEFGLEMERLNGATRSARARALVLHFARRGLLDTLLAQLAEERPNVDWHSALLWYDK